MSNFLDLPIAKSDRKSKHMTLKEIIDSTGLYVKRYQAYILGRKLSKFDLRKAGKTKEIINGKNYKVRLYHEKDIKWVQYFVETELARIEAERENYTYDDKGYAYDENGLVQSVEQLFW